MIWIRADANKNIGTEHVMRCLPIARELKLRGQQVRFLTADESASVLLEAAGQEYGVLGSDYTRMEEELPMFWKLFCEDRPDFVLVDSYYATPEYLRQIQAHVPVGILDDKVLKNLPVNLLINYHIFADAALYDVNEGDTEYLLGADYVPLRSEFVGVDYSVRKKAQKVLLITGESDPFNLAGKILKKLMEDKLTAKLEYLVVSGAHNEHLAELEELERQRENVHIFKNVSNMSSLMLESDIALSAGGFILYELSAVGVPMIGFSFADNQEGIVREFGERGLVPFDGYFRTQGEVMLVQMAQHVKALASDHILREGFSLNLRNWVDGQGAMRIAQVLCDKWVGRV